MYGKSNMEFYITICKIDSQRKFAVWLRKHKQGLCINLEWWDGKGDGREFQKGEDICIPRAGRGVLTNSYEKKRSEKQRKKGKINSFKCIVPKSCKER